MLPESNVAMQIRTALARRLKGDVSSIRSEDVLREDLGLDSLDMIELIFKIEEALDVDIPNEDLPKIKTVGDVITYVEARLEPPAATRPASKATAATMRPPAGVSRRSSAGRKPTRRPAAKKALGRA